MSTRIIEALKEDGANELASEIISTILDLPGVNEAVLAAIPDDFGFDKGELDHSFTVRQLPFVYLWEKIQERD